MKIRALFSLAAALSVCPIYAGDVSSPLELLQQLAVSPDDEASVRTRARQFPALGALPADTDSFFALSRVGELIAMVHQLGSASGPVLEMAAKLDSLAVGLSAAGVEDLKRLEPLFRVISAAQLQYRVESWAEDAHDSAARAIVAVQREHLAADGDSLVQATQDFHVAPVYFVLSAKEGGQGLLQQLSVLPMMAPMASDTPLEITVRGDWRGFCIHGNRLDLSSAGLTPEQESAVVQNLQNARLYVVARMVGKRLVFAICSNLDEVKLPFRYADSLLASPVMQNFDSCMQRKPWAIGYSSPAVVALSEKMNMIDINHVAGFMWAVFSRLGAEEPATSIKSLQSLCSRMLPQSHGAERMMVWGEDELYLHFACAAGPQRLAPGAIRYADSATAEDTAVYIESTPLQGGPAVDVPAVLDDVETLQKGYLATLKPELRSEKSSVLKEFQKNRGYLESLICFAQDMNSRISGSAAFLLSAGGGTPSAPASLSFRAEVAGAPEMADRLQRLCDAAPCDTREKACVEVKGTELLLRHGPESATPSCKPVPVSGAILFSVNTAALGRLMDSAELKTISSVVQGVDGATCTPGEECHTLLRVRLGENK